jgi:hypothetical protein
MVLEAIRAKSYSMIKTEVDKLALMLGAIITIAIGIVHSAHVCHALSNPRLGELAGTNRLAEVFGNLANIERSRGSECERAALD